jgi:predicted AlkP superfamily phosphohydrolase/phosphomutase
MKTIIIGFDAFDPKVFEELHGQGKLPNLGRYAGRGGYSRFSVSIPAQSEVSWTSIATGLDPGGHGMFDFVHRNPKTYNLHVSLLPTTKSVIGTQFARPHQAYTIFDYAVEKGYPGTALWWPAMFPARLDSPVNTIPGLGTPDILGKLGAGSFHAPSNIDRPQDVKTQLGILKPTGNGFFDGKLRGPKRKKGEEYEDIPLPFTLEVLDGRTARITIGKQRLTLEEGVWSPILELKMKMGFGVSLQAVTRVVMNQTEPEPTLYFLPLQIHPLKSAWPYGASRGFIKKQWKKNGPFLTLGWPQDTTGLEEGFITDEQFLNLCKDIMAGREGVFLSQLAEFQEGVLAVVFDSLDRVQHMFYRDRKDVVENWYIRLDTLFGRIVDQAIPLGDDTRILVVSDHGFTNFDYKVDLNRWLIEKGFLKASGESEKGTLANVDWQQSSAYALGLNSLYLNIEGREGQGRVKVEELGVVAGKLKRELSAWKGPDGRAVTQEVYMGSEVFSGALIDEAPDLVVGYTPGYRSSSDTGLGKWTQEVIVKNNDHWGADHCVASSAVPGVLFSNHGLEDWPNPSYREIPPLAVGTELESKPPPPRRDLSDEDQKMVEERLKGLGYL